MDILTHFHILNNEVKEKLNNTITSDDLIKYAKNNEICKKVYCDTFDKIVEKYVSGEIVLVNSKWIDEPESYQYSIYNLTKKPRFINKKNYKKIKALKANKEDWNKNWYEYNKKYKVRGIGYCNYRAVEYDTNTEIVTNGICGMKCKDFHFILKVSRGNGFGIESNAQAFVFKFSNGGQGFVNFFRNELISIIANDLMSKRYDNYIEEESEKCVELLNEL